MPGQSLVLTVLLHPVTAGAGFLIAAVPARTQLIHLSAVDVLIIAIYFAMVLFIGFYVKSGTKTSKEFFMAGREMTAWIAGLSFVSANLGSLELMGWAGSTYQYGILALHAYWVAAIPRHQLCLHDHPDERHQHVLDGPGDESRAGMEPELQHLALFSGGRDLRGPGRAAFRNLQ
jgi:hypothetical protein